MCSSSFFEEESKPIPKAPPQKKTPETDPNLMILHIALYSWAEYVEKRWEEYLN